MNGNDVTTTETMRPGALPARRGAIVLPIRARPADHSFAERIRRRVRAVGASSERAREACVVLLTVVLVGALVACLDHASRPPTVPMAPIPALIVAR